MNHTLLTLGTRDAEEVEALLRKLPSACWRELARGPREEPDCRLCDTMMRLDDISMLPEGSEERDAAIALLDYHEIQPQHLDPLRLALMLVGVPSEHVVHAFIGDLVGTLLFHRCQLIYEVARRLHAGA